ncbi:uncharacterized protein METZ01_LOCUS310546, partial [marine metagenome]
MRYLLTKFTFKDVSGIWIFLILSGIG